MAFFVNKEHTISYFHVPKTAGTWIKNVLGLREPADEPQFISFTTVRDPVDWWRSSYYYFVKLHEGYHPILHPISRNGCLSLVDTLKECLNLSSTNVLKIKKRIVQEPIKTWDPLGLNEESLNLFCAKTGGLLTCTLKALPSGLDIIRTEQIVTDLKVLFDLKGYDSAVFNFEIKPLNVNKTALDYPSRTSEIEKLVYELEYGAYSFLENYGVYYANTLP